MGVTMQDVAKEAGVSSATVSYVLTKRRGITITPSTRQKVLEAARRLNYRHNALAADLARGSTRVVGVHVSRLGLPVVEQKLMALEQQLREAGYYPMLCLCSDLDAEQAFFHECASRRFCGVVLMYPPRPESQDDLRRLMGEGVVVVSAEPVPALEVPYVTVDRGAGAEAAVRHLISLGHRRIAALNDYTPGARAYRDFGEGYRRGLAAAELPFEPDLLLDVPSGRSHFERGERVAERLLTRAAGDRSAATPGAILTSDDEVAIGVLRTLRRRGLRVPEDLALVGYDDLPLAAYAEVPLTTLAQPSEELGALLAELFLEGLEDPQQIAGRQVALPPRLIVRESCGAAPGRSVPALPGSTEAALSSAPRPPY